MARHCDLDSLAPIAPFWFWNGDMESSRILSQIDEMEEKGVRAFIICARQGLKVPYLSKAWFDRVRQATAHAKRLGMDVWLYDEQPYPSGVSGGRVVLDHPEFEARELACQTRDLSGGMRLSLRLGWGEVFIAKAYPRSGAGIEWDSPLDLAENVGILFGEEVFHETGLTAYNRKRFLACEPYLRLDWEVPPGSWHLVVATQVPVRGHKYFDRFVDPLNPAAIRYFLETTHERYARELGEEFGRTIKGIFTDELHPIGLEDGGIPWSPLLPGLLLERHGVELASAFPALLDDSFPDSPRIRYAYMDTVAEGFFESYDAQVRDWCRNHGILYIGEKPILRSRQLSYFDIPGIDAGHQKAGSKPDPLPARYRANARILSSAAHFYGKERCLCEAFHSIGWGMEIQDMKWTYDWLAMQGVDLFVNHAYYYTTQGLTKHDAPPSGFRQMPWWKHQKELSDYVDSLVRATNSRDRRPRILLLDPVTSGWTVACGNGELKARVAMSFSRTQRALFEAHFDFWVIDPDLLARASIRDGRLLVGEEGFDCLVLPPMRNLEDGAFGTVRAFKESGGSLIACECLPVESIGATQAPAFVEFWRSCFGLDAAALLAAFDRGEGAPASIRESGRSMFLPKAEGLAQALERAGLRDISVTSEGVEDTSVHAMAYYRGSGTECFVMNPGADRRRVRVSAVKRPGSSDAQAEDIELGPFESRLLRFDKRIEKPKPRIQIPTDAPFAVEPDGPNALRLDLWDLSVDGGGTWGKVRSMPIVDQLQAGGLKIPALRKDRFGTPKTLLFPELDARYRARFFLDPDSMVDAANFEAWIEPDGIGGDWSIDINGHAIDAPLFSEKEPSGILVLSAPIGRFLKGGVNYMELRLRAARSGDGLRNPIYLSGDFGVECRGGEWHLGSAREKSRLCEPFAKGFPFFAGELRYSGNLTAGADCGKGANIIIDDNRFRGAAELVLNGKSLGRRAWHPYAWEAPEGLLEPGENRFTLIVATTRIGCFEGQYYEAETDRYVDIHGG